jgi:hypothetical protein
MGSQANEPGTDQTPFASTGLLLVRPQLVRGPDSEHFKPVLSIPDRG